MKILKRIFYSIIVLLMVCFAGIVLCAFNPSLTQSLAETLYGTDEVEAGEVEAGEVEAGDLQTDNSVSGVSGAVIPGVRGEIAQSGDNTYVPPSQTQVTPPEEVSGKTGYQPVREDTEEVPQDEAGNLEESLETGETGTDLSFDSTFYPYYAMLQEDMQALYRQIYANAQQLNVSFAPINPVTLNQLKNVFEAVYNDHPELFWLETGYSCKYLRTGECIEITLVFNRTADNLAVEQAAFNQQAQSILAEAQKLGSTGEKEQYVHDALVNRAEYDTGAELNQSAYSALVNGRTVCAGYARAFQYLMQQLGVPCYYCTGYSGEDHAWNIIEMDGQYYNVDVTWDDTDPSTYNYYNKSDADFASTHVREGLSVYLPACGSSGSGNISSENPQPGQESTQPGQSSVSDLINPNPQEPLSWGSTFNGSTTEDATQSNLDKAGITADEVLDTMEKYYEDCLKQMEVVGAGAQQFINVVPESLWNTIERAYSSGSFQKGYVDEGLKKLGMNNFAIQLQVEKLKLDGGYYRLYHTISSWN